MPRKPADRSVRLDELSMWRLLRGYRRIDLAYGDGTDAQARAAEADRIAEESLRRNPEDTTMWFDRGLYAKWRRDWEAAQQYSVRALDLIPAGKQEGRPAAWNLGIAATARGDWATARRAWAAFGVPLSGTSDDPVDEDFGPSPVRLNPEPRHVGQQPLEIDGRVWDTEVVWGMRIDPTRIRLVTVPLPGSGHRHGDVVLHDGDPHGSRPVNGEDYPVFDEIELWERSPHPTLSVDVRCSGEDAEALMHELEAAGLAVEDWTTSVRMLCRACSEGSPDGHSHAFGEAADGERRLGISGDPADADRVLDVWRSGATGRDSTEITVELE